MRALQSIKTFYNQNVWKIIIKFEKIGLKNIYNKKWFTGMIGNLSAWIRLFEYDEINKINADAITMNRVNLLNANIHFIQTYVK